MRADYLDPAGPKYQHGLKVLLQGSQSYSQAHIDHVPTETAPGHAAIVTGKPPGETGIVGNDWWDRDKGAIVDAFDDPNFIIGPAQLRGKAIGDQLKEQIPEAKVVAISYKDRSAVMMGGHKADVVLWFDKAANGFVTSAAYKNPPEWLPAFNQARQQKKFNPSSLLTDQITLAVIKKAIEESRLGEDEHCDLLAVSFSGTDFIGHSVGPTGPSMRAQLLSLDQILGELLGILTKKTGGNFVLALTSDHGVLPVPESLEGKAMKAKRLPTKLLEAQLEASCQRLFPAAGQKWVVNLNMPYVTLNRSLLMKKQLDWGDFLLRISNEWKTLPDVAMVYLNNPLVFQDRLSPVYQRSYFAGRCGDLTLRMKSGVLTSPRLTGTSHGSPNDYDTHVPLLFYGPGFPMERSDERVSVEIIAPALAKAIGIAFE